MVAEVKNESSAVFDANSADRYQTGHIPTAVHVDYAQVSTALPAKKDQRVVFYCGSEWCSSAKKAATAAISAGYNDVCVYPAGIKGWKEAGHSVEVAQQPVEGTKKKVNPANKG